MEDALSETMLRAYQELPPRAAEIDNLGAWLGRIAYNICIERWRHQSRLLPYDALPEGSLDSALASSNDDPIVNLIQQEAQEQLITRINGLPPHLRGPLILRVSHEMSYAEIGVLLQLSETNARKRIQLARSLLEQTEQDKAPRPAALPPAAEDMSAATAPADDGQELLSPQRVYREQYNSRVVRVTLRNGAEWDYNLGLGFQHADRAIRMETLRHYIDQYPSGWKKRLELADILYATGQMDEAIEEYCRVLSRQRNRLDVWKRLAKALTLRGEYPEAQAVADWMLSAGYVLTQAERRYLRGLREMCGQHFAAAVEELADAATDAPDNPHPWRAQGLAFLELAKYSEAAHSYAAALKCDPTDSESLINSHDALIALGRVQEAERNLEQAVAIDPRCVLALKMLAVHRCTRGWIRGPEGKETRQLLHQARKVAPDAVIVREALAHYCARRGEWDTSRQLLQEFTERHPRAPQGWFYYAAWQLALGEYNTAADAALKARILAPHSLHASIWACIALAQAGRLDELEMMVEELRARFPQALEAFVTAGLMLAGPLGDGERGRRLTEMAVQQQPQVPAAWLRHGKALAFSGRYAEAIEALQQGQALLPAADGYEQATKLAWWQAKSYAALGDTRQAERCFQAMANAAREWIAFEPPLAHYALGVALEACKDRAGARAAYRAAIKLHLFYPERASAEEALQRLRKTAAK